MYITLSTWTAACAVISTASAFYPYELHYGSDSDGKVRRAPLPLDPSPSSHAPRRSLTLPLRRAPKRLRTRENQYKIVESSDPKQKNSVAIDQDGTDLSYMVVVTFGSSKEEYHLLMDSAASNTWVMGEDCASVACGKHNTFGAGDSSTLKTDTTAFSITYGTGSVSGTTASDTIHVGPLSSTLTFGLATNVSSEFTSYPMDGILGIGRGDTIKGTIEAPQLVEVLSTNKLIPAKLYGIHLSRAVDGTNDGELNFGEPNKDRFDGDLNWRPAVDNDDGFWEVDVDDIGVDGTMAGIKGRTAIMDTGTSFILMPKDDAVAVHKLIDGYTQSGETFTVPCDTNKPVQIKIGSVSYDISTKDFIGDKSSNGACTSKIIGRTTFSDTEWLVGDVFLKNVYTVFDFDNSKVGFGVKSEDNQLSSSASASASSSAKSTALGESSSPSSYSSSPSTSPPESTSTANALLPAGASATASRPVATSGPPNPTAAAEGSVTAQDKKGASGQNAVSSSILIISVALALFSV